MQFHEVEDMRTRNFFFTGWPHTTAVIRDIKTGEDLRRRQLVLRQRPCGNYCAV